MGARGWFPSPSSTSARRALLALGAALALSGCGRGDERAAADRSNVRQAGQPGGSAGATIALIRAADWVGSEWSEDAIRVGLREEGLEEGRDFRFHVSSAQGDLATIPSLIDAARDAHARVIVALQDPTLRVAVQRAHDIPVVFHVLADPFAAGAGTSDSNHLANITGVYSPGFGDPEQEQRIALIRRLVPKAHRVGVLFAPDEPYAVAMKDKMTSAGRRVGLDVVAVPVPSMGEAGAAATTLVARNVDAIEIFGNAAHAGFMPIIQVANAHRVPVFSPSPYEMLKGAMAAIYPDFADGGIVAGHMVGRILKGESPGKIPFHRVTKTKTLIGHGIAASDAAGAAAPSLGMATAHRP